MAGLFWIHCRRLHVRFTDLHRVESYQELATKVARQLAALPGRVSFSVAGAQGTGKSTFAKLLVESLRRGHSETVALLSLDDFYLTRTQRLLLAENVHPLLATRGVPGTHDVDCLRAVIAALKQGKSVASPVFDKATDDRLADSSVAGPARIVVCEGWCWGARPESDRRLDAPVNDLEMRRDPEGAWRRWVNRKLREYQDLFRCDATLFFAAPSMASVLDWRWQQEQDLMLERQGDRIMTRGELEEFIACYQRITTWMLRDMPARADIVVTLDRDHRPASVRTRGNSGNIQ